MGARDDRRGVWAGLLGSLTLAVVVAVFLWTAQRVAAALLLAARVDALSEIDAALTVDERERLISRIKAGALAGDA